MEMLRIGASLVSDSPAASAESGHKHSTHDFTHTDLRKDRAWMFTRLFLTLGPLLPCCAELACVRSGSDHPPVLRTEIRHRQLQYKHLEKEIV